MQLFYPLSKKRVTFLKLFILFILSNPLKAQNLVPNPSFEFVTNPGGNYFYLDDPTFLTFDDYDHIVVVGDVVVDVLVGGGGLMFFLLTTMHPRPFTLIV